MPLSPALVIGIGIGAATSGSVLVVGTNGVLAQDNANLFWNDSTNQLGIGTAAPAFPLHLVQTVTNIIVMDEYSANANAAGFIARKSRGTVAAPLRTKANDALCAINARGSNAADDVTNASWNSGNNANFRFLATEDHTATAQGTSFTLNTSTIGTTTSTTRLTIDENGLTLADALNLITGTTTGMKIGTATTQKLGFYNATPIVQPTDGATLTNNVTVGGTTDTIADYSSLTVYATDAAAIRNDIYQLARKLKIVVDNLRSLGLES